MDGQMCCKTKGGLNVHVDHVLKKDLAFCSNSWCCISLGTIGVASAWGQNAEKECSAAPLSSSGQL